MAGGGRSRQAADAMRPPRLPPPLAADRGRRPAGVRAERRPTDLLILAVACMGAHARAPLFDPPAAPGLPPVGDGRLSAGRRPPRSSPARAPSPPPGDRVSRTWGEVCVLARCELEPSAREKLHWQRTYGYRRQITHAAHQGACTWAYARSPVAQDEQIAGEAHEIDFISEKKSERDSWGSAFELRRLRRKSSRSGIDLARTRSNCYRCVVHGTEKGLSFYCV